MIVSPVIQSLISCESQYSISQVVAMCGDGRLTDREDCETSKSLRFYLKNIDHSVLNEHLKQLLGNSFVDSGLVLQDLVNTLGSKLGFEVEFGRYRGNSRDIGHDGLWLHSDANIIIEVKTTDAYRINTNRLIEYSERVREEKDLGEAPPVLIIVGRQDTGDLESQIRGCRADDRISIIGAEKLLHLTGAALEIGDGPAISAIRTILTPRDYTRIDTICEVITTAAAQTQQVTLETYEESQDNENSFVADTHNKLNSIEYAREKIVRKIEERFGKLKKESRAKYSLELERTESLNHNLYVVVSKFYDRSDHNYWYSIQNSWLDKIGHNSACLGVMLGFVGLDKYVHLDNELLSENIKYLNETHTPTRRYWHVSLRLENENLFMSLPKKSGELKLELLKL